MKDDIRFRNRNQIQVGDLVSQGLRKKIYQVVSITKDDEKYPLIAWVQVKQFAHANGKLVQKATLTSGRYTVHSRVKTEAIEQEIQKWTTLLQAIRMNTSQSKSTSTNSGPSQDSA